MKLIVICGIFLFFQKSDAAAGHSWSYSATGSDGPAKWKDYFEHCDDKSQSPIDIDTDDVKYDKNLGRFALTGFGTAGTHLLKNNGHTVQIDVDENYDMKVTGGGLTGTFTVAQFHFHWGPNVNSGSEHTLDGKAYPLEMHIVTYNSDKYAGLALAADKSDGLAVLGYWFEVGDVDNCHYDPLVSLLNDVANGGTNTSVPSTSLANFIGLTSRNKYYRYKGSLTTPACYESVTWTVFTDTIKVSAAQLQSFRNVYEDDGSRRMTMNYRPVQPLNGRQVYSNFMTNYQVGASGRVFVNLGLLAFLLLCTSFYLF